MATKSFYEDMVIDTPEAAANLERMLEEDNRYAPPEKEYILDDPEVMDRFIKKYNSEQ